MNPSPQSTPPKPLSGLQRICKAYGRMKCGDTMMAWDYVNNVAIPEKELQADKPRWKASEKAKWATLQAEKAKAFTLLEFLAVISIIAAILLIIVVPLRAFLQRHVNAPDKTIAVTAVPKQQVEGQRFNVETAGKFNAGYEKHIRELLIITDTQTGQQYLGITGVGITELHRENKATKEE